MSVIPQQQSMQGIIIRHIIRIETMKNLYRNNSLFVKRITKSNRGKPVSDFDLRP